LKFFYNSANIKTNDAQRDVMGFEDFYKFRSILKAKSVLTSNKGTYALLIMALPPMIWRLVSKQPLHSDTVNIIFLVILVVTLVYIVFIAMSILDIVREDRDATIKKLLLRSLAPKIVLVVMLSIYSFLEYYYFY